MEIELEVEKPREAEALILVLDSSTKSSAHFDDLRQIAFRVAKTRLTNAVSKDDLISVVTSGSLQTSNNLATENQGGYLGIDVLIPPVSRILDALKALLDCSRGTRSSNLLDILDVCGDLLSTTAAERAKQKRVLIFTDGQSILPKNGSVSDSDLQETCALYREHKIRVDVICHGSQNFADLLQDCEDELAKTEDDSVANIMRKCERFQMSTLVAIAMVTNGMMMSLQEASPLVDHPTAKVKKAMAKFRGVLNIADLLKIPVKRFSYVAEASPATAKKISWNSSCKRNAPVSVCVETQRVASAKDDSPLDHEELVNAYPYGPELVPEGADVDTYAWSMHLPRGLDVLGFVPQEEVPQSLFLGPVDVVVAIAESKPAVQLMKSLVLAMQADDMGILARSVTPARGGAPSLAYLWPKVELDRETRLVKSCFLFVVNVPMREDYRELHFSKLGVVADQIPEKAYRAMNEYVLSSKLDDKRLHFLDENIDSDEDEPFWPSFECNPNLDWFNACIIHRALGGVSVVDFPPLTEWQQKIIDPSSFVGKMNRQKLSDALSSVKTELPVVPVVRREKKGRKLYQALSGDLASIKDYLPANDVMEEQKNTDGSLLSDIMAEQIPQEQDADADLRKTKNLPLRDVGDENPATDFRHLVQNGQFRFAALSLLVVVRRLIRDGDDDNKAVKCLQVLREASIREKDPRFFNDFVSSSLGRCTRADFIGNRTAAFFRHVGKRSEITSTLEVIRVTKKSTGKNSKADEDYINALDEIAAQVSQIAQRELSGPSVSMVTTSSRERGA